MKIISGHGLLIVFFMIFNIIPTVQAGETILIAAASNLRFAMDEMCSSFKDNHPSIQAKVSYGSSGNFFAQIKQGAPYDIFFQRMPHIRHNLRKKASRHGTCKRPMPWEISSSGFQINL